MSTHRIIAAVLALVVYRGDALADANSLNDGLGPREIAVGESMRADARGALATTLNPAGLALNRELVFEGSYGYRPGDSASAVALSACDSTVPVAGCFYYRYFSAAPELGDSQLDRRAHEFGTVAARALAPRVLVGLTGKYFDYESENPDEGNSDGFGFDVGVTVRASDAVNVAFVANNLWAADSAQYPRAVAGGVMLRPTLPLTMAFDALWNLDTAEGESSGRYGGGAEYFISTSNKQAGYPIRAGAVYDNQLGATYITAGIGFLSTKMGLDVGARKEVDGGDELMIHASLRIFGPRQPMPAPRGW